MKLKSLACAILLISGTASAAILTNGDFEAGGTGTNTVNWTSTGWSHSGNVFMVPPFNGVKNGRGFWFGAGSLTQDGHFAIAFNAGNSSSNSNLWQTFSTISGRTYDVDFDFGATSLGTQQLNVGVLGANGSTSLATYSASDHNTTNTTNTNASYKPLSHFSFSFMANGTTATLIFSDTGNPTIDQDGVLDNVRVTEVQTVPEPLSGSLFGLGLTALMWARRHT